MIPGALSPPRARPATLSRYTIPTEISVATDAAARHDPMQKIVRATETSGSVMNRSG